MEEGGGDVLTEKSVSQRYWLKVLYNVLGLGGHGAHILYICFQKPLPTTSLNAFFSIGTLKGLQFYQIKRLAFRPISK